MSIQEITSGHFLIEDGLVLSPARSELTVSQAARFVCTSDRHMNDLLDAGEIPFLVNGNERIILCDNLLEFERKRELANAFLDELLEMSRKKDD